MRQLWSCFQIEHWSAAHAWLNARVQTRAHGGLGSGEGGGGLGGGLGGLRSGLRSWLLLTLNKSLELDRMLGVTGSVQFVLEHEVNRKLAA